MIQYSDEKRKGNIGEAFVQGILSSFCLVHKIDGSQDIGNDFICELTKGEYPANILFYVQVKYWKKEPRDSDIKNQFEYWKSSPIPVFLFWIDGDEKMPFELINDLDSKQIIHQLKYKRYTPITHGNIEEKIQTFKSFSKFGFLRDIMVDYARCLYKRGMSTVIKKEDFSEIEKHKIPLGDNCLFVEDVIPNEYKTEFITNSWTNLIATAKSLYTINPNDEKYLTLALEHAELAKKMIDLSSQKYLGFIIFLENLIKDIQSNLEKIKSK